ncbi:hypothetical protein EPO05_02625 [Patescibacteria group bacterium]|nr:MAG: hypothetical protein EPO05_02625 [Patescibacteria group bacterium]
MEPDCQKIVASLAEIQKLKASFDASLETSEPFQNVEQLNVAQDMSLELEAKIVRSRGNFTPREIKAIFANPETGREKPITIDFQKELEFFSDFYQRYLGIALDQERVRAIWRKHQAEIKTEMEQYGYDKILIIPDDLPDVTTLKRKLIEGMPDTNPTRIGEGVMEGGAFRRVKAAEGQGCRVVLIHSDQNIFRNSSANPFLKATLNKDISQLSGLDEGGIMRRMANYEAMPINFKVTFGTKEVSVRAEGLSLESYMVMQRIHFEQTKAQLDDVHLDERGWTWLVNSLSPLYVVVSNWNDRGSWFNISAYVPGFVSEDTGARFARSFTE